MYTFTNQRVEPVRGFTLIEILVCVAIIGILSSILVVAVGQVRQSAKVTASASNLRQIGQAASLYRLDNNNEIMPLGVYDPNEKMMREWCFSWRFDGLSFQSSIIGEYIQNVEEVLRCPIWEPSEKIQSSITAYPGHMGYGYNSLNMGERVDPEDSISGGYGEWKGYNYALAINPSNTVAFTTAATRFGGEAAPPSQGMIWSPKNRGQPCVRLVNETEALVGMLDGSVTLMNATTEIETDDGVRMGYLDKDNNGTKDIDIWYLRPEHQDIRK